MTALIDNAIYNVLHDVPKGCVHGTGLVELAQSQKVNAGTLQNKANPTMDGHQLTVKESVRYQRCLKRYDILYAEAAELDHCCIPLGNFDGVSDVELLESYAAWKAEIGETDAAVSQTFSKRGVTRHSYNEIRMEIFEDIQRAFEFLQRVEAVLDD